MQTGNGRFLAILGLQTAFVLVAVMLAGIGAARWGLNGGDALRLALGAAVAGGVLGNYVFYLIQQITQILINLFPDPDPTRSAQVIPVNPTQTAGSIVGLADETAIESSGRLGVPTDESITWLEIDEIMITRRSRRLVSMPAPPPSPTDHT